MTVAIHHGDMREVLARLIAQGVRVDSVVTDPPYHLTMAKRLGNSNAADVEKNFTKTIAGQGANPLKLAARGFMGKAWDGGDIAFQPETWRLCYDLLPPGGHVLDPFAGSGTTGMACMAEGFRATLIEREAEYVADIRRRIAHVSGEDAPLFTRATT